MESFSKYFRKAFFGAVISAGSLLTGFFVYYIANRKKFLKSKEDESVQSEISNQPPKIKEIPLETLEKILKKLKNRILISFANLYNKTVLLSLFDQNKKPKVVDQSGQQDKDVVIETVSQNTLDQDEVSDAERIQRETLVKSQIKNFFNSKAIVDQILKQELIIVDSFGFNSLEYVTAVKKHLGSSEKVRSSVELLFNFKKSIEENKLLNMDFPEIIEKNYIKIISNIYYLNARKVMKDFKSQFNTEGEDLNDPNQLRQLINKLYSKNLKETRNEIKTFFEIPDHPYLDLKVILRLYYYYLKPFDEARIKMDEINADLNELLANMESGFEYEILINEDHPKYVQGPIDGILDFSEVKKLKKNIFENLKPDDSYTNNSVEEKKGKNQDDKNENYEKLQRIIREANEKYDK